MFAAKTLVIVAAAGFAIAAEPAHNEHGTLSTSIVRASAHEDSETYSVTKTKTVLEYTTYLAEPTTLVLDRETYIVERPTTLTISECPCATGETTEQAQSPVNGNEGAHGAEAAQNRPVAPVQSQGAYSHPHGTQAAALPGQAGPNQAGSDQAGPGRAGPGSDREANVAASTGGASLPAASGPPTVGSSASVNRNAQFGVVVGAGAALFGAFLLL